MDDAALSLKEMLRDERLMISSDNLEIIALEEKIDMSSLIREKSVNAGLSIVCATETDIRNDSNSLLGNNQIGDILFVIASELKENS
jgi:hypothetical protein